MIWLARGQLLGEEGAYVREGADVDGGVCATPVGRLRQPRRMTSSAGTTLPLRR